MASSAQTIRDTIASAQGAVSLEELHAAVLRAGINKTIEQVYADTQSLASRGSIGRANAPRTYCRLTEAPADRPVRVRSTEPVAHRPKGAFHPTEGVLAVIESELGPPVARPKDRPTYAVVLLGEWDGRYVLNRACTVLQRDPQAWCRWTLGPNTVVGFL
jgi:hypothetical protein